MANVLITIGRLNIGGAERRLLQVVQRVHAQKLPIRLTVFVVSGMPGVFDEQFRIAGVELIYGRPGVRGMADLWLACRRLRPTVLCIQAETAAGFYGLAGALAGVPSRIANYLSMQPRLRGLALLKSLAYQVLTNLTCQRIIGISQAGRERRLVLRPWQTIHSGVEPPTSKELAEMPVPEGYSLDRIRVAVVGRIGRGKNVDRAVRVFAALHRLRPDTELHIIGPFADIPPSELAEVVRLSGVPHAVTIHGPVTDPYPCLAHASILLVTSSIEGLPGIVIEALACGTPVVSTDLPGVLEIAGLTEGIRSVSLSADDEEWAAAIVGVLDDSRAAIRAAFEQSPFRLDRYTHDVLATWNALA